MQALRIERMAELLGVEEHVVIRHYGKPVVPPIGEVVYLIGHTPRPEDGEPVKIGYTRQRLRERIEALQPGSINPLMLISYRPGGRDLEREIHDRLCYARIREDWFEMCDEVRDEFDRSRLESA